MNRYDVDYYQDVSSIKEILKRMNYHLSDIADALKKRNDDYEDGITHKEDVPLTITNKENKK